MNIEARIGKLESAVVTGDGPTLLDLLGIPVQGTVASEHVCNTEEQVWAAAAEVRPLVRELLELIFGISRTATPEELATAVIDYRRERRKQTI